jgi:myo-inositol 2-dehydrogenase / D-chiro-inositol 1-dehydrogenase
MSRPQPATNRRHFLATSAAIAGGASLALSANHGAFAGNGSQTLRIGLVGCGGRGTGAAAQALTADPGTQLVALGDAFDDQLARSLKTLQAQPKIGERVKVDEEHRFVGFDAFEKVLASDIDVVLLATPPHFRPQHLRAAIDAGVHAFVEKPVAVDGPGVQSVLESCRLAREKSLSVVSGLCWRYEDTTIDLMKRLHDGAIGEIVSLEAIRYNGGVEKRWPRQPGVSEMTYQLRNWYYHTWLSADFNTEQHVHELDRCAWALGNVYPTACTATGGRLVRTGDDYGNVYDHFAGVFEYASGARMFASTRHQPGCSNTNTVYLIGTEGVCDVDARTISDRNGNVVFKEKRPKTVMHQREHDAMYAALRDGRVLNDGDYMANSTLMGLLQRQSAYTGKRLSWEQMQQSIERLGPSTYTWDAAPPAVTVALPGITKFT